MKQKLERKNNQSAIDNRFSFVLLFCFSTRWCRVFTFTTSFLSSWTRRARRVSFSEWINTQKNFISFTCYVRFICIHCSCTLSGCWNSFDNQLLSLDNWLWFEDRSVHAWVRVLSLSVCSSSVDARGKFYHSSWTHLNPSLFQQPQSKLKPELRAL